MKRTREDQFDPESEVHLSSIVREFLLEDEEEVRLIEESKTDNREFREKTIPFVRNNKNNEEDGKILEENEYVAPHNKKKRELISSRRHLVRKIASLVRPTTKKMHVGLWKYVMAVKNSDKDNLKKGDKLKAYISKDAKLYTGNEAFKKCKEDKIDKTLLIDRFGLGLLTDNQSKLEFWGLPLGVVERFHKYTKIRNLFEWQIELLKQDGVFSGGKSLVYFAPTSGGKSLPAELIMLHNIFVKQKRGVYILPFVSIVNEKTRYLRRVGETSNVRIEPFGSQSESIWTPNVDIAVGTIEKANSLLNKVIEEGSYRLLDIFVFDELHMILDGHRGYQIEYILTKLKALEKLEIERISEGKTWDGESISPSKWQSKTKKFQIIGMSATMGQSDKLEQWLECKIFESDYRPVPLSEYYVVNDVMYNKEHEEVFKFSLGTKTFNDRIKLLIETYFKYNKSVILFGNTKNAGEKLAKSISSMVEESYEIQENMADIVSELTSASYNRVHAVPAKTKNLHIGRQEILRRLSLTSVGLCDILKQTIKFGIAYHHSGLTDEERNIIENGYREGHLLLIGATSTLSTGINLPAKAVIFNRPLIGAQLMDKTHYKQMSGRAGRTGFDTFGESIMLGDPSQKDYVQETLLEADFSENVLHSTIDQYTLRRAILEVIASTSVKSFKEIGTFLNKLLKFELLEVSYGQKCQMSVAVNQGVFEGDEDAAIVLDEEMEDILETYKRRLDEEPESVHQEEVNLDGKNGIYDFVFTILKNLKAKKFLALSGEVNCGTILPTPLGKAGFASSIPPEEGLQIFTALFKARLGLQLSSDLHLCYLVTMGMSSLREPQWLNFSKKLNHLLPDEECLLQQEEINQDTIEYYIQTPPGSSLRSGGGVNLYLDSKKFSQIQEEKKTNVKSEELDSEKEVKILNKVENLRKYARFYNALILQDILKETPINKIAETYGVSRGIVQSMQLAGANASGILGCFGERLQWTDLTVLFMRMNERLNVGGIADELCEITRLPSLRSEKARILYDAGITTIEAINEAPYEKIFRILMDGEGFMSKKEAFEKENKHRHNYISHIAQTIKIDAFKHCKQARMEDEVEIEGKGDTDIEILSDIDELSSVDDSELIKVDERLETTDIFELM